MALRCLIVDDNDHFLEVARDESGLDLARDLAEGVDAEPSRVILISTYAEGDLADVITASPAIAFLPKARLSGRAIDEIVRAAEHPPDRASPDGASPNGHSSWRARGKRHPGPADAP
jgi:hypothetical protein